MAEDGLEYFEKLNKEISKLDRTVVTQIDETVVMKIVDKHMKKGLGGRTTEGIM